MSAFRDLPVSRKLFLGIGSICFLTVVLGAVALYCFHSVNVKAYDMANNAMPSVMTLAEVRFDAASIRRSDAMIALCDTPDCVAKKKVRRQATIDSYKKAIAAYGSMISYPGERELYNKFHEGVDQYIKVSDEYINLIDSGKTEEARKLILQPETLALFDANSKAIEEDQKLNNDGGAKDGKELLALGARSNVLAWAVLILSVTLSIIIGIWLTRAIAPPLLLATEALERVAQKDLTVSIDVHSADEVGRLATALNQSMESIRNVLIAVAQGTETLTAATTELTTSSIQSSGNATAASGKTNQIAAAAQEMTATISEISNNAESAAGSSRTAAETAQQGGAVMQSASETMEKIATATQSVADKMSSLSTRSHEIGKVVNVIQEISEQTNLLALNAAIEAARAGEHGRGFAVVAGEVRRLAERTKSATEEIAGTIRSIQQETEETLVVMQGSRAAVEVGMGETSRAHQSLEAIISASKEVEHQIHLIATATTEQAAASGEIAQSAGQISQLSNENAQGAEEAVEALRSVAELANNLDGMVKQFNLGAHTQSGGSFKSHEKKSYQSAFRGAHA